MLSCQSLVPAGAGTPRYENRVLTGGGVCGSFATHTPTLDSGLRRNDEWGGILFALTSILSHRWRGGGPHLPGRTTLPPLAGDKRRRYRALWCWGLAPAVRVCLSSGGCGKRLED